MRFSSFEKSASKCRQMLDRAILVIESLNGPAATRSATAHMTEDGYVKHRMLEIRVRFPSTVIRTAHQVA
jgi:hypothetical protein